MKNPSRFKNHLQRLKIIKFPVEIERLEGWSHTKLTKPIPIMIRKEKSSLWSLVVIN
jgi:hypothetical protein